MMCEACKRDEHWNCGMQTWCECDCAGPDGCYELPPDPYEISEVGEDGFPPARIAAREDQE